MGTPRIDALDRNFLINGNFEYAQYSYFASVSMLPSLSYLTADRWKVGYNSSWSGTPTTRVSGSTVPAGSPSKNALLLQGTPLAKNANTNLQAAQLVESVLSRFLANKTVTLSVWYYAASGAGSDATITVEFSYPTAVDNWTSSTLISTTTFNPTAFGSWQQKLITIALPSNVTNGLGILYKYGNLDTGGVRQFYTTDNCLLLGERPAVEFVYAGRDAVEELQLCQRYFEKSYNVTVSPGSASILGCVYFTSANGNPGGTCMSVPFKVEKRVTPIATIYNPSNGAAGFMLNASGSVSIQANSAAVGTTGLAAANAVSTTLNHVHQYHWTADAEL